MLEHLKLADGFAERLTFTRPLQALFQSQLRGHVGHQRQGEPLALKVAHDAGKPHVFGADQMLHRHPAIIEEQLGGIGGPPAHFLQLTADAEARGALFDQ